MPETRPIRPKTSKVFVVSVLDSESKSHADEIARVLRKSFPHREYSTDDKSGKSFAMKVKAESEAAVRDAISSAVRNTRAYVAETAWLGKDGKWSYQPQPWERFEPPIQ